MFFNPTSDTFKTEPFGMDARLRARLGRLEFFALALAVCVLGILTWVHIRLDYLPYDYDIYLRAVTGDLQQYYYAPWILPLFWLFGKLPYYAGFVLWGLLGIACLFLAARVFGGRAGLSFLTFQFCYIIFLGQITGILIGGLALGWWGMAHRRWYLAGLGFLIAASKFQLGLALGLLLWLAASIAWSDRLKVLAVPVIAVVLSLVLQPSWPADLLERIRAYAPYDWASISLWRYMGVWALGFFVPLLFIPIQKEKRILALAACCTIALPYFQQADLLALYVLPVGWLPVVLGNLGFLFFPYLFAPLQQLWIIPACVYLAALLPALGALVHRPKN